MLICPCGKTADNNVIHVAYASAERFVFDKLRQLLDKYVN